MLDESKKNGQPINWEEFLGQETESTHEPITDDFKELSDKIIRHLSALYEQMDSQKRTVGVGEIVAFAERFLKTIGVNAPVKILDDLDFSMMTILGRLPITATAPYSTPFALVALSRYDIDNLEEVPTVYIQNPQTMKPVVFNT